MTVTPRSMQATAIFVAIPGLKTMDGPEGLAALAALHRALRETLVTPAKVPGIRVLSCLTGAIVLVPDEGNGEAVELFTHATSGIAEAGVAVRAGFTHGPVELLDDADGTPNVIGVCLNSAARVATAKNNPGLLVEASYASHVAGLLPGAHWLHPRKRTAIEVAGKRTEKFQCFAPPPGAIRILDKSTIAAAEGLPAHVHAVLLAYDLPSFSDGDARQLASRFRSIVQEIQRLDDGALQAQRVLFSSRGDGGVLAIEGIHTSQAYRVATELETLLNLESLSKANDSGVRARIGLHYGPVFLYDNAEGIVRPTGPALFDADELAGGAEAKKHEAVVLSEALIEEASKGSRQYQRAHFEEIGALASKQGHTIRRFVRRSAARPPSAADTSEPDATHARAITGTDGDTTEQQYRASVIARFAKLPIRLPGVGAQDVPLEEIYVDLLAVSDVAQDAGSRDSEERRLWAEVDRLEGPDRLAKLRHIDSVRYEQQRGAHAKLTLAARPVLGRISESLRPLIVLGDPGSGKSTLLRLIALQTARKGRLPFAEQGDQGKSWLPIFVPIAAYDECLETERRLPIQAFLLDNAARQGAEERLREWLLDTLRMGRAIVLFDGLDETRDRDRRNFVVAEISAFVRTWMPYGNRFVITSRVVGYGEARMPDDFATVTLADLGFAQIEELLTRWQCLVETAAEQSSTLHEGANPEARKRALLSEIAKAPHLHRLARNPLMLTMLAALHQDRGLPSSRAELYSEFTEMVIGSWPVDRSAGARQDPIRHFSPSELRMHASALALWLQRSVPGGMASRERCLNVLSESASALGLHGPAPLTKPSRGGPTRIQAERIFDSLCRVEGLISARAHDSYGFLHRTFQEFLAAEEIAAMSATERWSTLQPNLHNPLWREVVLLCTGRLCMSGQAEAAEEIAQKVLLAGSAHESVLHRDAFLVSAMVTEGVLPSSAVVGELYSFLDKLRSDSIPVVRSKALIALAGLARCGHTESVDLLARLVLDAPSWSAEQDAAAVYVAAARVLDSAHCRHILQLVSDQVSTALSSHEHADLRLHPIIEAMGKLAWTDKDIRGLLITLLRQPNAWRVDHVLAPLVRHYSEVRDAFIVDGVVREARQPSLYLLAQEAPDDPVVRPFLEGCWHRRRDPYLISALLPAVAHWALRAPLWRTELLECLKSPDGNTRGAALSALVPLAEQSGVKEEIVKCLAAEDSQTVSNAISVVGRLIPSDPSLLTHALQAICRPEAEIRRHAVVALRNGCAFDPTALSKLKELTRDHDVDIRRVAIAGLAGLPSPPTELRETLHRDPANVGVCGRAERIAMVAPLAPIDPTTRHALERNLTDPDPSARAEAAAALTSCLSAGLTQPELLLPLLQDSAVLAREAAFRSLGGLLDTHEAIREAFTTIALSSGVTDARIAVQQLARIARVPSVRAALLSLFSSGPEEIRLEAAAALAPLVPDDAEVRAEARQLASEFTGDALDPRAPFLAATLDKLLAHDTVTSCFVRAVVPTIIASMSLLDYSVRSTQNSYIALLDLLTHHARALGAFDALMSLREHWWYMVRFRVMEGLSSWFDENEDVRKCVLDGATSKDFSCSRTACEILARNAGKHADARRAVMAMASMSSSGLALPYWVAENLVQLTPTVKDIELMFRRFFDDPGIDFRRRMIAAEGLSSIAAQDPDLPAALLPWLGARTEQHNTMDRALRRRLAQNLAAAVAGDSALRRNTEAMLDSPAWQDRQGAAWTLLSGPAEESKELVPKIRALLEDSRAEEGWSEQLQVAKVFLNHPDTALSRRALGLATEATNYGREPWSSELGARVRQQAAEVLEALKPTHRDTVLEGELCIALREEPSPEARNKLYMALLNLASAPTATIGRIG